LLLSLLALAEVARYAGVPAFTAQPHLVQGKLERKCAASLVPSQHFTPYAYDASLAGGATMFEVIVLFCVADLGQEHFDVVPYDFAGRVPEVALAGRVECLDVAVFVDGKDAVDDGVENRLQPPGAVAQPLIKQRLRRRDLFTSCIVGADQ
jgi:hypothetical protein